MGAWDWHAAVCAPGILKGGGGLRLVSMLARFEFQGSAQAKFVSGEFKLCLQYFRPDVH